MSTAEGRPPLERIQACEERILQLETHIMNTEGTAVSRMAVAILRHTATAHAPPPARPVVCALCTLV